MKKFLLLLCSLFLCCQNILAATFTMQPLSADIKKKLIENKVWSKGCPVPLNRLKLLTISYFDIDGKEKLGHLIVFDGAAFNFLTAFKKLYQIHYPLENVFIGGVEENKSVGGTTTFDCRLIRGEPGKVSLHSYGLAIDINVLRNPYLGEFKQDKVGNISGDLIPSNATSYSYLNRAVLRPGMNEQIVKIMAESGFIVWGGSWQDRVDYQHFQVPDNIAVNMAFLDEKSAAQFMQLIIRYPESANKMSADSRWKVLYELYPKQYMQALERYFYLLNTENGDKVINIMYQWLSGGATG